MTETEQTVNVGSYSKLTKISMMIISMLLIFAGPTYVPYVMSHAGISGYVQTGVGGALFVVGILFLLYIVDKKIITA